MTDIFLNQEPIIQAAELRAVFKAARIAGSRLCSAALDGKAMNLTRDALENALSAPFDALPDKTEYARYVMTPGTVYLGFDSGNALAVRFPGSGAVFAKQVSTIPQTETNVDLCGLFSSVAGQTVCKAEVSVTEEKPEYFCIGTLKDCNAFIERILLSFEGGKTLVLYALLDNTIAGVLDGANADMIRLKALRRHLR